MKKLFTLSFALLCGLTACKSKDQTTTQTQTQTTTQTQSQAPVSATPQVSNNPDVVEAQKMINTYISNGRACVVLSPISMTSTQHDVDNPNEPGGEGTAQWEFLVKHGVATAKKEVRKLDSGTQTIYHYSPNPKLTKEASNGQGYYLADNNSNTFCYGKWLVTKVLDPDVHEVADDPSHKMIAVEVVLTDAPAWVKEPGANVLNQPTDDVQTLKATDADGDQKPATLNGPNRVVVSVPK